MEFGEFIEVVVVEVKNGWVIVRDGVEYVMGEESGRDEMVDGRLGYGGRVREMSFCGGKVVDEVGVEEVERLYVSENGGDGIGVNSGGLDSKLVKLMSKEKLMEVLELRCEKRVVGLKFVRFLVENRKK